MSTAALCLDSVPWRVVNINTTDYLVKGYVGEAGLTSFSVICVQYGRKLSRLMLFYTGQRSVMSITVVISLLTVADTEC